MLAPCRRSSRCARPRPDDRAQRVRRGTCASSARGSSGARGRARPPSACDARRPPRPVGARRRRPRTGRRAPRPSPASTVSFRSSANSAGAVAVRVAKVRRRLVDQPVVVLDLDRGSERGRSRVWSSSVIARNGVVAIRTSSCARCVRPTRWWGWRAACPARGSSGNTVGVRVGDPPPRSARPEVAVREQLDRLAGDDGVEVRRRVGIGRRRTARAGIVGMQRARGVGRDVDGEAAGSARLARRASDERPDDRRVGEEVRPDAGPVRSCGRRRRAA